MVKNKGEIYKKAIRTVLTPGTNTFQFDRKFRFASPLVKNGTSLVVPHKRILGKRIESILPSYLTKGIKDAVNKIIETKLPQDFEYPIRWKRIDKIFSVHLIPTLNPKTASIEYITTIIDVTERKKAETELNEIIEKNKMLYDASSNAIMMLAPPDWRFTSGNPATVKMFGAKNEKEFISKGPWELSPPKQPDGTPSVEKAKRMIKMAMKTGSNFFEWTHRKINGKDFPAEVLLTRVELGGKTLLHATVWDVTERKKAEESLQRSEQRYSDIFENANDIIHSVDRNGRFIRVNRKWKS